MGRLMRQKRIAMILAAALGIGALTAWATEGNNKPHYAAGTYLAASEGIGTVLVAVTVDEDTILDIELDVSQESPDVGGEAAAVICDQILDKQTVKVDNISGATKTSTAVKEAVERALRKASLVAISEDQQAEIANLNSNVEELQSMVDLLSSENATLLKANAEKEQENASLRNQNESQKTENDSLKAENEKLSETNASLQQKLENTATADEVKGTTVTEAEATEAEEVKKSSKKSAKEDAKEEVKETLEETTVEVHTEAEPEQTSNNLVSMEPVEEKETAATPAIKNKPAFTYAYVGMNTIYQIQQFLENLGYPVDVDGIWGENTQEQLLNYQISRGLESNGEITAETLRAMFLVDAPGASEATSGVESNALMKQANMLSFTYTEKGWVDDTFVVNVKMKNTGDITITDLSVDCVWYNLQGQRLATTNLPASGKLKAGKSDKRQITLDDSELIAQVASVGVGAYTYKLASKDENGYSTYHVNLLTGEVKGS